MVPVGELARTGCFPDGDLVFVYYQRHPVHRFDADGNPRRPGARHGRLLRGDDLWGDPHAADMLRHPVDYHRREPDRRGECGSENFSRGFP